MKKFLCLTLILCFTLSFSVGCKKNNGDDSSSGASSSVQDVLDVGFYEQGVKSIYGDNGIDFILNFNQQRDIKILQLADLQIQDLDNARNENRKNQLRGAFFSHGVKDHQTRVWRYVDEAVWLTAPDLIVLTGDNIYGETDDDGSDWDELCNKLDSYRIPWLTVFGNHDNESYKGVLWQIERLKASKYCVFSRGNVTGNSNYSVLISQNGKAKYLFYMLDTNGCTVKLHNPGESLMPDNVDYHELQQGYGIFNDQISWFENSYSQVEERYGKLPVMMFMHVPPADVRKVSLPFDEYFCNEASFGICKEPMGGFDLGNNFFLAAKRSNCKGLFVGHQHKVATSFLLDGIRVTYGLKTSTYDYHDKDMLGSTMITLNGGENFSVEYLFSKLKYPLE